VAPVKGQFLPHAVEAARAKGQSLQREAEVAPVKGQSLQRAVEAVRAKGQSLQREAEVVQVKDQSPAAYSHYSRTLSPP
jgi:hypothetical protein